MKKEIRKKVNAMYDAVKEIDFFYMQYAEKKQVGYLDMLVFYELMEDDEPFTQKRMCDVLEISKTTLNSIMKRWIEKGYIELQIRENNHREKDIILTDAGKTYAHELIDPLFGIEETAIQTISIEDIQTVESIVNKYHDALNRKLEEL